MLAAALQRPMAWAEDRATQRCDPSADPGAKTEGAAGQLTYGRPSRLPALHPLRDWHQSDKPSRQDAATQSAGCIPQLANANRPTFQFLLNQDNMPWR